MNSDRKSAKNSTKPVDAACAVEAERYGRSVFHAMLPEGWHSSQYVRIVEHAAGELSAQRFNQCVASKQQNLPKHPEAPSRR